MSEPSVAGGADSPLGVPVGPSVGELSALTGWLSAVSPTVDDAGRIDRIAALERLKQAVCAAQAVERPHNDRPLRRRTFG